MHKPLLFILFSFFLVSYTAFSQEFRIAGSLVNTDDKQPLVGATVKLTSARDSLQFKYTTSGINGEFEFTKLKKGPYVLEISYIGFENFRRNVGSAALLFVPSKKEIPHNTILLLLK